jgi:hypothetical protein
MRFSESIVDALPSRLWRPGNLFMLPGGDWHFCVGTHPRLERSVRTVEWRGREIARGRREFDGHESDAEADG